MSDDNPKVLETPNNNLSVSETPNDNLNVPKTLNDNLTIDYQKLSELYGSFLGALGGVSITVLSIVMALNIQESFNIRQEFREDLFPYLIASLSAATFSSFTGGHLMTETAAFISKWPKEWMGTRLCAIATINIYISVILIIFSLILMVVGIGIAGLDNSANPNLTRFFIVLFIFVVMSAMCWMGLTIKTRLNEPVVIVLNELGVPVWKALLIAYYSSLILWIGLVIKTQFVLWTSLFIIVICTFASLAYFILIFYFGDRLRKFDVYFFTLSVILSCFSIAIACYRLLAFCKPGVRVCT